MDLAQYPEEPTFAPFITRMFYDEELDQSEKFYQSQPLILQLCYALYNMLVAHSEMVCFLVIIINHMVSANFATLVLPVTIFLWAMLSVPRPSKRYWMTAIVFTEVPNKTKVLAISTIVQFLYRL